MSAGYAWGKDVNHFRGLITNACRQLISIVAGTSPLYASPNDSDFC